MNTSTLNDFSPRHAGLKQAMVLAAGLGTRMRPITNDMPKPLVRVAGRTLLDHCLDALDAAGVEKAVVNVHYLPEQIEAHLGGRRAPHVIVSDERDGLLDSGGGIVKALPHFGEEAFAVLNSDSFWVEGYKPNLARMAEHWDEAEMDILLLVAGMAQAVGYNGTGDFTMDPDGRLERRQERKVAPFIYAGAAILHPRVFADAPQGAFSLNRMFDAALERGRLFGVRLEGLWLHVGTPEAISEAEEAIAISAA